MISETYGVLQVVRFVRLVLLVRVVKQWLKSRADGELHIIGVTWSVGTGGTSRTSRTSKLENIRRKSVCCGGPKTVEHDSTKT